MGILEIQILFAAGKQMPVLYPLTTLTPPLPTSPPSQVDPTSTTARSPPLTRSPTHEDKDRVSHSVKSAFHPTRAVGPTLWSVFPMRQYREAKLRSRFGSFVSSRKYDGDGWEMTQVFTCVMRQDMTPDDVALLDEVKSLTTKICGGKGSGLLVIRCRPQTRIRSPQHLDYYHDETRPCKTPDGRCHSNAASPQHHHHHPTQKTPLSFPVSCRQQASALLTLLYSTSS
jgi:hypothetical protein